MMIMVTSKTASSCRVLTSQHRCCVCVWVWVCVCVVVPFNNSAWIALLFMWRSLKTALIETSTFRSFPQTSNRLFQSHTNIPIPSSIKYTTQALARAWNRIFNMAATKSQFHNVTSQSAGPERPLCIQRNPTRMWIHTDIPRCTQTGTKSRDNRENGEVAVTVTPLSVSRLLQGDRQAHAH